MSKPKRASASSRPSRRIVAAATGPADLTMLHRREFRAWRASLPTPLERETLLMPEAIAESVVQEAERFLKAVLPADYAERLAAKAHYLYPRHKHFHKMLNRPAILAATIFTCTCATGPRPGSSATAAASSTKSPTPSASAADCHER